MSQEMNRRQLLVMTGAMAAGACVLSVCGGEVLAADADKSTTVNAGAAAQIAAGLTDKFAKSDGVMIVREGNKIYSLSSTCTHRKSLLKVVDGQLRCPSHGSRFTTDGKTTKGPATVTLPRYGVSIDGGGNLIIDKTKTFDEQHWADAGASVEVK